MQSQLSDSHQDAKAKRLEMLSLEDRIEQSAASQLALQQQLQAGGHELKERQSALEGYKAQCAQLEAQLKQQTANADTQLQSRRQEQQQLQTQLSAQLERVSGNASSLSLQMLPRHTHIATCAVSFSYLCNW